MKKSYALIILLLLFQIVRAQRAESSFGKEGTIEVIAYSSTQLLPSDVYISFVLKEYTENNKLVSTEQSLEELKVLIINLGCNKEDLRTGNVYGYLMSMDDGTSIFKHKTQYILRMNTLECAHQLLNAINNKCIESFNIDELNTKQTETIINDLQEKAFKSATEKADVFLSLFKEKRGRLLEIQEIDKTFIQPESNSIAGINKTIKSNGGIQYYETKYSNSKNVKIEYAAKVIFEIK